MTFFTCSLIDYIARKTKNKRAVVVDTLGNDRIRKIYDLADVYHSIILKQSATILFGPPI